NSITLVWMCDQPESVTTLAACSRKCRYVYYQLTVDFSSTSYVQRLQFSGYGIVGSRLGGIGGIGGSFCCVSSFLESRPDICEFLLQRLDRVLKLLDFLGHQALSES